MNLKVNKESLLYDYLRDNLNESKNTIKGFLSKRMVTVNDKVVTKYDYKLKVNDNIKIGNTRIVNSTNLISIIYEDDNIVAVNKPSGLLVIATLKEKEKTLYNMVSNYVKDKDRRNKIFIIHRLDKDTSGVVLFAKSEKVKNLFQEDWNNLVKRKYVVVVHGNTKKEENIVLGLKESKDGLNTYVDKNGDKAITRYSKISGNDLYSYIDVEIDTGKKNQIRVSLSHIGYPIVGDKKYGIKDNADRLMLHAKSLDFIDPITNKKMHIEANEPKIFDYYKKLIKKGKVYE